jgi:hypothetical protein
MKKLKIKNKLDLKIVFLSIMCFCLVVLSLSSFQHVEFESSASCNTGDVDFNISTKKVLKQYDCLKENNLPCFEPETVVDYMQFNGVDGLNCEFSVKTKFPLILLMFGMGE